MACERCGGRMLSRAGNSRPGLVCSDCGTPRQPAAEHGKPHPVLTGMTLLAMAAFSLLLFFLTNWKPLPAHQASQQRGMLKQITTGEFVREQEPLVHSGHDE